MKDALRLPALVFVLLIVAGIAAADPQNYGATEVPDVGDRPEWVIAIHGGAGGTEPADLGTEKAARTREDLRAALEAGAEILEKGGTGIDAIEAALRIMEDSVHFNAGRGAVLDEHGVARHDASIMRGEDLAAGAIAGSSRIRNPISAARAVMEQTQNVMLHGDGANWFAEQHGLEIVNPLYFITEERRDQLLEQRAKNPDTVADAADSYFGTVGAVVLDKHGNISAGTTTGGRTNKRFGRIGDTPIIGAGTYAANQGCAVSGTGHGEYFMRWTVARDICARMEFDDESLKDAAEALIVDALLPEGGYGAVIAMDPSGNVVFVSTTANLKRGVMSSSTPARVAINADDEVR